MNQWQVATAAEAFAAAQFARCGWDVLVQYGANLPEYDLVAVRKDRTLKVSVKGSQDGAWGLTQSYKKATDYHGAADIWLKKHTHRTVFCLVQFKGVSVEVLPRMYLATPREIANQLKAEASNRGDTILYENHKWTDRAHGAGTIDRLPEDWRFSKARLEAIIQTVEHEAMQSALPRDSDIENWTSD